MKFIPYFSIHLYGNASCLWITHTTTADGVCTIPTKIRAATLTDWAGASRVSPIHPKTNVPPSEIYFDLKIKPGEMKIIIDSIIWYDVNRRYSNGRQPKNNKEPFSLFLTPPPDVYSKEGGSCFHSIVIFTPKPGLFDETPPS